MAEKPDDPPVKRRFSLTSRKVTITVPPQGDLPEERVVVLPDTIVFEEDGTTWGTARDLVKAWLRAKVVRSEYSRSGSPEMKWFEVEIPASLFPENLYVEKIEPKVLRPITSVRVVGDAHFDPTSFPISNDNVADVKVTWFTGKKSMQTLRFGLKSDVTGKCSSIWTCSTEMGRGESDVYVTSASMKKFFKVSLHDSGSWQMGLTSEYAARTDRVRIEPDDRRHFEIWRRPKDVDITAAFSIIVVTSAARLPCPPNKPNKPLTLVPAPKEGAVEFTIVLTRALTEAWPGKDNSNTSLVGTLQLESGETLWVVYRNVPVPPFGQLQLPRKLFESVEVTESDSISIAFMGEKADGSRFICEAPLDVTSLLRKKKELAAERGRDHLETSE